MYDKVAVGLAIRATRKGRMSLQVLAAACGASVGTLSQIENGHGNPSFALLNRIADALHVDASDLLHPTLASTTAIVRADTRVRRHLLGDGRDVELLTPDVAHALSVSRIITDVGETREQGYTYSGESTVLILSGEVEVTFTDDTTSMHLETGDAVWYTHPANPRWRTIGNQPVETISVFCPSEAF